MKGEEMRKYLTLNNRFTAAPVLLFALTVAFSFLGFLPGGHAVVVSLLAAAAVSVVMLLNINDFPCHAIWFDEHNIDYELIYDGEGIEWQDFYETTRYHFD